MALIGYIGYLFFLPFLLGAYLLGVALRNPVILVLLVVTAIAGFCLQPLDSSSRRSTRNHHVSDFLGERGMSGLNMNSAAVRDYHSMPVYEDDWVDNLNVVAMPVLDPFGNFLTNFQPYVIGMLCAIILVGLLLPSLRRASGPRPSRRSP